MGNALLHLFTFGILSIFYYILSNIVNVALLLIIEYFYMGITSFT